jgi:hypothetical protein
VRAQWHWLHGVKQYWPCWLSVNRWCLCASCTCLDLLNVQWELYSIFAVLIYKSISFLNRWSRHGTIWLVINENVCHLCYQWSFSRVSSSCTHLILWSSPNTTCLVRIFRWWHADVRPLLDWRNERPCSWCLSVFGQHLKLDAIEQAPVKCGQDRFILVCDFEATPLASVHSNPFWIWDHITIVYSPLSLSIQSRAALLYSGRSAVFVGLYHPPLRRHWSCHSF